MKIAILMLHMVSVTLGQYQWTIFDQEHVNLCSEGYSCGGRVHTMCYKHWDRDLQAMAERWVRQCIVGYDECDFIGNPSYPVGQNVFFHPKPILKHWEALALSTWFSEKDKLGNNLSIGSLQSAGVSNYTQLIWARTQFVGCGAASMYGGHLIVCYYHPKGNIIGQPVYKVGRGACTGCPQERASCSHVFRGLCGIAWFCPFGHEVQTDCAAISYNYSFISIARRNTDKNRFTKLIV
uniref:SCP domain-containing protein n=1 Tax=Anopheles culicifacies TaxID=139723 RepID=A0A182MMZ0_9DIPT